MDRGGANGEHRRFALGEGAPEPRLRRTRPRAGARSSQVTLFEAPAELLSDDAAFITGHILRADGGGSIGGA